jgi:hypothetical protein
MSTPNKKTPFKTAPAHFFMPASRLRPFRLEQNIDLPATDAPKFGQDAYVCFEFTVPKGQVYLVKSFVFTAAQRIDIGNADESPEYLTNEYLAGQVGFEILVSGQNPLQSQVDRAQFAPLAAAQNAQRARGGFFTSVSTDPDVDLLSNWWNPLLSFAVRAGQRLQSIFRILPVESTATALAITTNAATVRRVDFAGAFFAGNILSESDYTEILRNGEL